MEGKLVFNQLAPRVISVYICRHLVFSFIYLAYTQPIHTYANPLLLLKTIENSKLLITLNSDETPSIWISKTRFRIPFTSSSVSYKSCYDPPLFFEEVFRDFRTSRLVLIEFLVSKICEADPIILRISSSITYLNFIEF